MVSIFVGNKRSSHLAPLSSSVMHRPSMTRIAYISCALLISCEALAGPVQPTECQKLLVPVDKPNPPYPSYEQARNFFSGTSYLHTFVQGSVSAEYVVEPSGTVSDVQVLESSYEQIGKDNYPDGYFDGFLDTNVISTLKTWRLPTQFGALCGKSNIYIHV